MVQSTQINGENLSPIKTSDCEKNLGIKIGVTGPSSGMTFLQELAITTLFKRTSPSELHHGDCIGCDCIAHDIMRNINPKCAIVGHPPKNPKLRAFCRCDISLPEKDYLERNMDIALAIDFLIATPNSYVEKIRSGTWATVRYARKCNKHIIIIPNGSIGKG